MNKYNNYNYNFYFIKYIIYNIIKLKKNYFIIINLIII